MDYVLDSISVSVWDFVCNPMAPAPNQPPPQRPQPPRPNTPEPGPSENARAPTGPAPQPQNQGTRSSHFSRLSHRFGQAIQRGQPACTAQAAKPIPSPAGKHSAGEKEEAGGGMRWQIASPCDPPPRALGRWLAADGIVL